MTGSAPPSRALGARLRQAIERPFGERWTRPRIVSSVFFTYTFHRRDFEDHLLPELHGVPNAGGRSARLALLQLQMSEGHRPVVFHDAHAPLEQDETGAFVHATALSNPTSFRLDTVPVRWGAGGRACMHAKHVLVHVNDPGFEDREALIVMTGSANLTLAGWRRNVELVDVQVLRRGQRTQLRQGLRELLEQASSWAEQAGHGARLESLPAAADVHQFVKEGLATPTANDPPLPRLWTGTRASLVDALEQAANAVDLGPVYRLSAGAPYFTESAAPLQHLVTRLRPRALHVLRPRDDLGRPLGTPAWEAAIRDVEGLDMPASVHDLHPDLIDEETKRTTHLKWILAEGATQAILAIGSPNLSDPAFGPHTDPGTNFETAILLSIPTGLHLLSENPATTPLGDRSALSALDPDAPSDHGAVAPFLLVHDWSMPAGERTTWRPLGTSGRGPAAGATLSVLGEETTRVPLDLRDDRLGPNACRIVTRALEHAPYVELHEPTAAESPDARALVQIVELRQELAPARTPLGLSLDQWLHMKLALALGDVQRAEREADRLDRLRIEADESIGDSSPRRPAIALDRPITLIQATSLLERRLQRALDAGDQAECGRILFERGGLSLRQLVDFYVHPASPDDVPEVATDAFPRSDLVDRLVCWLSVRSLLDRIEPKLAPALREHLVPRTDHGAEDRNLGDALALLENAWCQLDDPDVDILKRWMQMHWRLGAAPPQDTATAVKAAP